MGQIGRKCKADRQARGFGLSLLLNRMDALFAHALPPVASAKLGRGAALARQALYVRAHWQRMPPPMVVRHLTVKALRRRAEPAKLQARAEAPALRG